MEYLILIIFSLTLYSASEKINLRLFNDPRNILINIFIFSNFFLLIYLIISYLFIFEINNTYSVYLILFFFNFLFIFYKDIFRLAKSINFKIFKYHKIILVVLILYFFLIMFPAYDEDLKISSSYCIKKLIMGVFILIHG